MKLRRSARLNPSTVIKDGGNHQLESDIKSPPTKRRKTTKANTTNTINTINATNPTDAPPTNIPPAIIKPLDIKPHAAKIPHYYSLIDGSNFVNGVMPGISHLLKTDPLLPVLLGDHWKTSLFSAFLKQDHVLLENHPERNSHKDDTDSAPHQLQSYFDHIIRGVLAQQISVAAARSVVRKFKLLYHGMDKSCYPVAVPDFDKLLSDLVEKQNKSNGSREQKVNVKNYLESHELELKFPGPYQVSLTDPEILKQAGLSTQKCNYVIGIAKAFCKKPVITTSNNDSTLETNNPGRSSKAKKPVPKDITLSLFQDGSDEDIITALTALKGLGSWSAEMFLLFALGRLNVFSKGDLGAQRGFAYYLQMRPDLARQMELDLAASTAEPAVGKKGKAKKVIIKPGTKSKKSWKVPTDQEMEYITQQFSPYKSLFMLVVWKLSAMDLAPFTQ